MKTVFQKTRTKLAAYEPYWRLPSSPIVEKNMCISLCKFKSVLIYTWIAKPFILPLQIFLNTKNVTFLKKTRTKLAATEGDSRLRNSPIVENKTVVSLCKLKSVLIYTWIAKPFILPLQIFATITNKITFSQNSNETRRIRATLSAPDFANSGKQNCGFLM